MKSLGTWLGVAAIVLQIALPLLAGALPRSVALVSLCTVDGVAHYLEVPTGRSPIDEPGSHAGHCPLCCAGGTALAAARPTLAIPAAASAERFVHEATPPDDVTSHDHELWRDDEEALLAGRDPDRASYRGRFLRLGVLHHPH